MVGGGGGSAHFEQSFYVSAGSVPTFGPAFAVSASEWNFMYN